MENKKVKNATPLKYGRIQFKSRLEVTVYKALKENGFSPKYEKRKFILWKGYYPKPLFYTKSRKTKNIEVQTSKIKDITYTPDFTFMYNGILVIFEVKGFENDVFPLKKKMFRKVLERRKSPVLYFEVYNKKQTLQAIEIMKEFNKKKENGKENGTEEKIIL